VTYSGFYDVGPLAEVAVNLFYGWGYNFYRKENQLRADDQLIRAKAAWLLGLARDAIDEAERSFRREKLPAPTRDKPFPDPELIAHVRALEQLGAAIGGLIGRLHALPVPENDRMTQRYRGEAQTLKALGACDEQLIGQCDLLCSLVKARTAEDLLDKATLINDGLGAIQNTITSRQALLV
jgi:hypothetical protein